jgi:hypothetical protein
MAESSKDEQGLGYTLREEMRQISILHLGADSIKTKMTTNYCTDTFTGRRIKG